MNSERVLQNPTEIAHDGIIAERRGAKRIKVPKNVQRIDEGENIL